METSCLKKMSKSFTQNGVVEYTLDFGEESISMNALVGKVINLEFKGQIFCSHCGKKTKKSFSQGYCFPCMRSLPETDLCMVRPENCHYHLGTCRDEAWGELHCMKSHYVYLANSSGIKVGITRDKPVNRWIDQGASQGLVVLETKNRLEAGLVETALKTRVADKTNWRRMLKGAPEKVDLVDVWRGLEDAVPAAYRQLGKESLPLDIQYPVERYPETIKSYNFDKEPFVSDRLFGIKGQYLIFEKAVLNLRKFTGYEVSFSAH